MELVLGRTLNDDLIAFELDDHILVESLCKCALGTLNSNGSTVDLNINACGNSNGLSAYS